MIGMAVPWAFLETKPRRETLAQQGAGLGGGRNSI
jgi:hypothetical protein